MTLPQPASSTLPTPQTARRGAPPGNTNALKHGYYSERFSSPASPDLSEFDFSNLQEEINLVRLSLHQLCSFKSEITTLQEASAFLRLVCTGVATLNRLMRTAALLQSSTSRPHRPSYLDLILAERAALLEDDPPLDPIADPEFFPDPTPKLETQPEPEPSPGLANQPSPVPDPPSFSAPDPDDDDIPPCHRSGRPDQLRSQFLRSGIVPLLDGTSRNDRHHARPGKEIGSQKTGKA